MSGCTCVILALKCFGFGLEGWVMTRVRGLGFERRRHIMLLLLAAPTPGIAETDQMRRQYELTVRQEPKQARMCGIGGKGALSSSLLRRG